MARRKQAMKRDVPHWSTRLGTYEIDYYATRDGTRVAGPFCSQRAAMNIGRPLGANGIKGVRRGEDAPQ